MNTPKLVLKFSRLFTVAALAVTMIMPTAVFAQGDDSQLHLSKTADVTNLPIGGGNVTFTLTVTNSGPEALSNVHVNDPDCGPVSSFPSGDTNNNQLLEMTETWTYVCVRNVNVTLHNVAHASATLAGVTIRASADVRVNVGEDLPLPGINLMKSANPSNLPIGGGNVTYTFTVNNSGSSALSNIQLQDPSCSPISTASGDADNDQMLDVNETWTYTCSKNVTANSVNVANVSGTANGITVRDIAIATVRVQQEAILPVIHLEKSASPVNLPAGGGNVVFTMTVTNPGSAPLSNIVLWDSNCSPISAASGDTNNNQMLESNETWTYTCSKNVTSSMTNIAAVSGRANGRIAVDIDQANVTVGQAQPSQIRIQKSANVSNLPFGGGNVTYTLTITNPGNNTLSNVQISDPSCSPISSVSGDANNNQMLEVSETWTVTCTKNLTASHTNTASVSGTFGGQTFNHSASATVNVANQNPSQINLVKSVNNSNLPAGGGNVTYTLTVTNPGNNTLSNVQISDPSCSPISSATGDTNNNQMLETSETWTYTCSKSLTASHTNTATVSGTFNGQSFTDTASATVNVGVSNPNIQLAKSANVSNLPFGGGNVTYTLTLTNPGSNTLSNIQFSDPNCSPLSSVSGDNNNNQMLETSETWSVTCTKNVTATGTNTATVSGVFNNQTFTDTASATVNVAAQNPSQINLVKSANVSNLPFGGGNVTYTLTLTNPGQNTMQNVQFSDPSCSPLSNVSGDANDNDSLEINETWTVTCTKNVTASGTNTATVSAVFNNQTFTDTASATVNVASQANPSAINLTKVANNTSLPFGGGSVTYTLTVDNSGQNALTNIQLNDPSCSPLSGPTNNLNNANFSFAAGQTLTFTCTGNVTASNTNTATVSGVFNNQTFTDTASATVNVAPQTTTTTTTTTPTTTAGVFTAGTQGVNITKIASPATLNGSGNVTFTISVSNPGNSQLTGVLVTDNGCSPVVRGAGDANTNGLLDPGETWTYTCSQFLTATTTNVATVSAQTNGQTVTGSAQATVNVSPLFATTTATTVPTTAVSPSFVTQAPTAVAALPDTGVGPDDEEVPFQAPISLLLAVPVLLGIAALKKIVVLE